MLKINNLLDTSITDITLNKMRFEMIVIICQY